MALVTKPRQAATLGCGYCSDSVLYFSSWATGLWVRVLIRSVDLWAAGIVGP